MSTDSTTPFRRNDDTQASEGGETDTFAPIRDPFPGEFRLVRPLGNGNFGDVWLAIDLSPLGREVALKFLRVSGSPAKRDRALAVLRNEARILAGLRHPNIVQVHAWREAVDPTLPCLVLQYVAGGSFADRVKRDGPMPWQLAARYIADISSGLLLLHRRGIIHRDLKPANMLLDPESDEALLTDFGIAARLGNLPTIAGTLPYMAPEAFLGEGAEPLDVYGLAASLFWLITGSVPFVGHDVPTILENIKRGLAPADPRFAAMPADVERLIRSALVANPAKRPSLTDFQQQLRASLNLLLADCLPTPAMAGVEVRLMVSRYDGPRCVPIASSARGATLTQRDMRRVPARPESVQLRTGDRIRIEVAISRPGHVTVFNIGPTGNLTLLLPAEPGAAAPHLPADQVLHVLDVEMTPPAGQERLVAVWTKEPLRWQMEDIRELAENELALTEAYKTTRNMARMQESLNRVAPGDRQVVVLELDHQEASGQA